MTALSSMAVLETAYFTFYAFGGSKEEALSFLEKKWKQHAKRTGAYWEWANLLDSVYVVKIQAGAFERSELPNLEEEGN